MRTEIVPAAPESRGEAGGPAASAAPSAGRRVDALLRQSARELERLYRGAKVPELGAIRGDLRGRMLTVPSLWFPWSRLARLWASREHFPWRGKTFTPLGPDRGEGVNRVFSDRWRWYRFTTHVGPSKAGPFDAVQLDYDHPDNPFFIRAIEDEIRELEPGLFLGQAYARVAHRAHLVLWFGLESPARADAPPPGEARP